MKERMKAIILAKKKYREYDELIWLYSEKYGILSAVIQGIKRKRSKYEGALSLFSLVYLEIKLSDGLSTIYNFELIDKNIDDDSLFITYTYGASLSELTRRVLPEHQPIQGMFDLLATLIALIAQLAQPELAVIYLKQKLLPYTGSHITLDACVVCGQKTHIIGYSYRLQGLVCADCQDQLVASDIRDTAKIKILVAFFRLALDKLASLVIEKDDLVFLILFWDVLYEQNLGITLKSQKVQSSMKQLKEEISC